MLKSVFKIICVFIVVTAAAHAQNNSVAEAKPVHFGTVKPEIISADAKLSSKTVCLVHERVYLSELMRQWTKQTGIAFESHDDGKDTSGRWRIMIALRHPATVSDAMDALRSALSTQGATWQWERTGDAPNFKYRLIAPSYQRRDEELRKEVQSDFANELDMVKGALKMTPNQIKEAAASDTTGVYKSLLDSPEISSGIAAFLSNVPDNQQQAVMEGSINNLTLPFSALNDIGKGFALERTQEDVKLNSHPGATMDKEMPTRIIVQRMQSPGKATPSLMLLVGNDHHFGGGTYVGGNKLESRWRRKLAAEAILRDDDKKSSKYAGTMDQKIEPKKQGLEPSDKRKEETLEPRMESSLLQLAEASSPQLNFIACLPQSYRLSPLSDAIYGHTLNWLLEGAYVRSIANKWQHDILLFHYTAGFANEDEVADVPTQEFAEFVNTHRDEWTKQQMIPSRDMVTLAQMGTAAQWMTFRNEWGAKFYYLENLQEAYPIFALMAKQNAGSAESALWCTGSESGCALPELADLSQNLLTSLGVPEGTPASARIVCGDNKTLSQQFIGTNRSRVIWMLVMPGEDGSVAPNRLPTVSQGGILKHAAYTIPAKAQPE